MYLSRYLITTYAFISSDNYISCNYYNIYYNEIRRISKTY